MSVDPAYSNCAVIFRAFALKDKNVLHISCSERRAADQEWNRPCQKDDAYLEQQPLRLLALQHVGSATNNLSRLLPS